VALKYEQASAPPKRTFGDLKSGDVFLYSYAKRPHMKLDTTYYGEDDEAGSHAVDLTDGTTTEINDDTDVTLAPPGSILKVQ
jgi:hypothetical protein